MKLIEDIAKTERWVISLVEKDGELLACKRPIFTVTDELRKYYVKRGRLWLRKLKHPNILALKHFDEKTITFCMEYAPKNLRKILDEKGKLPIEVAIGIVTQIASALEYAHKMGIVHADIKPENIFFDELNTPKLGDWEDMIILIEEDNRNIYTPEYAAPEQLKGNINEVDTLTDIYQLGKILYEMVEGERAIKDFKTTPKWLQEIIIKCVAEKKEER